jgi:hypothetical protein
MSIEAMAVVLHHSQAGGTDKVVLLGIANHDGDGGAWPSVASLVKYARRSRKNVQEAIRRLEDSGEIRCIRNAGGLPETPENKRPNRYEVLVRCPEECDGTTNHRMPGDYGYEPRLGATPATPQEMGPANLGATPANLGATPANLGATPATPKPSFEPSLEPKTLGHDSQNDEPDRDALQNWSSSIMETSGPPDQATAAPLTRGGSDSVRPGVGEAHAPTARSRARSTHRAAEEAADEADAITLLADHGLVDPGDREETTAAITCLRRCHGAVHLAAFLARIALDDLDGFWTKKGVGYDCRNCYIQPDEEAWAAG